MTRIGDETVNSFSHGRKSSIGTTAVALTSTAVAVTKGVQLRAADANAGVVYVGTSSVTTDTSDQTDGFPLAAGETLFVPIDDARKIYLRGTASGQKVFWLAI
ncbi:MAG: hypothetical protein HYX69_18725 [Planctomycetia bacterium]|nr:hypothetical protein [Planctomycetia bacterium]